MALADYVTWFLSAKLGPFKPPMQEVIPRCKEKGTKPHQLLPNLTEKPNFLQKNVCADYFENVKKFASHNAENSLKFAHEAAQLFSEKGMEDTDIRINKQEPITIGAIVNPSLLWACYPPGVNKKATYLKHQIDEELNEYFAVRVNRIPVPPENLEKHSRVSVRYNNLWFRGVIMGRKLDGRRELFSVLLVDVGVEINDLTDNMIFELPEKVQAYEIQAFLITLHGIVPLSVEIDISAGKTVLETSQSWGPYQHNVFQNILDNHDAAYFKTTIVKENVRHGILYITKGKEKINLNQILVNSKLAHDLSCEIDVAKYLSRKSSYHRFVLSILKRENQMKIPTYTSSGAKGTESANLSRSTSRVDQVQTVEKMGDFTIPKDDCKNNNPRYHDDFIERSPESRGKTCIYPAGFQRPNKKKSQVQTVEKSRDCAIPTNDFKNNQARYHDDFIECSPENRGKTCIYAAGFQRSNKKKRDHQLVGKESTSKTSLSEFTSRMGQAQTIDGSEENTASVDDSKNNHINYFDNLRENSPESRAKTFIYPADSQHANKKKNIRQVHEYGASIQNTNNSNVGVEKTTGLKLVVKSSNNNLKPADSIQIALEHNDEKTFTDESMNLSLSSKNEVNLSGDETEISLSETDNKLKGRIWNNIVGPQNQSNDDKDESSSEECDIELPPRKSKITVKEPEEKSKILLMFNKSLEASASVDCSTDPVPRACFKGAEDRVAERNASGYTHLSKNTVPDSSFSERVRLAASTLRTITIPAKVSVLNSPHSFSNANNVSKKTFKQLPRMSLMPQTRQVEKK